MNKDKLVDFQYHFSVNLSQMFEGGITVKDLVTEKLRDEFYNQGGLITNAIAEKFTDNRDYYIPFKLTFDEFMQCLEVKETGMRYVSVEKPNDIHLDRYNEDELILNVDELKDLEDLETDEEVDNFIYGTMSVMIPITLNLNKAELFFTKDKMEWDYQGAFDFVNGIGIFSEEDK